MFILNLKLKNLKHRLKIWNKTVFGNVNVLVKDAEQKLILIQANIDSNGASDLLLDQQKFAHITLENALNLQNEEEFWREKSHASWHSNGAETQNISTG